MKIGLLLTSKCNRACSYCDHMTTNSADFDATVDLEHILDILSLFPKHSHVELSGGEPGLLANLLEIIDGISSLDNVDSIDVLSTCRVMWGGRKFNYHPPHITICKPGLV